jgi:hypothetical protein
LLPDPPLGRELRQIIGQCGHGTVAECRIIEALSPYLPLFDSQSV